MKIPFRYQFILAPLVIVVILAGLIAYTLYVLAEINHQSKVTRHWEILTDQVHTSINSAGKLRTTIASMLDSKNGSSEHDQEDQFFTYLEQARIFSDSVLDPNLLDQVSPDLRKLIQRHRESLKEPENVNPAVISRIIDELMPLLDYQSKIFVAQRRTQYMGHHRQLVDISSRLTTVLLVGLITCIALASILAIWGLYVTRRRLNNLTRRANQVCTGEITALPAPGKVSDELDDLEHCLFDMTERLLKVVSVENVLLGVENERRRMAMDMHDGALADLTAINRHLDGLQGGADEIKQIRSQVDEVIRSLRATIDDLHPQVLETLGLKAAFESFLDRNTAMPDYPKVVFEFEAGLEDYLTLEQKLALFRIFTEVVNNVFKHARCTQLEISVRKIAGQLVLTIEDNGIGRVDDIINDKRSDGHGYQNVTQRANLLGASVSWQAGRFSSGIRFELKLTLRMNS